MVSLIGKQRGQSVAQEQPLIIRLGRYSQKKLLYLEEATILNSRFNTRLVLVACIFIFQYGIFQDLLRVSVSLPYPFERAIDIG